ncbi:uncharacterized protein SPPG_03306 [Spizellomyces punctatus DAOM BR117]|uniref:Uncharacterized protein n=1 Tax=Spizellomyces punctatus (strain DAOM BR117) TaxID=645134 RepID=A0A0L0HKE5_SPIPD|nr:uncharacterized protein SPPG_03306 [Spizellomyces punctatus DAOM BR117]KND01508.1 hypothetical protein SPPG_03306 [Spizellomyces punctatus DAOM BR117]|eukprot:XP_016609547.1 hypothetical protein SPPG_03306 [Spizellomyces punctatus DAOM BR117]
MGNGPSKIPLNGLAVVITGCDTGFGYETALQLAASNSIVYATCLTAAGVKNFERLRAEQPNLYGTLRPYQLDVTDWEACERFGKLIEEQVQDGLFGLVNNAGINSGSYFSWSTIAEIRKVMDVNYMGAVHMMKALMPSLRRFVTLNPTGHAPRIVNITSVAGRTVAPIIPAYCASKHALEAMSDGVRMELRHFGIRVAIIEPWFASTPLVVGNEDGRSKQIRERYESLPHREDYGKAFLDHHIGRLNIPPPMTMEPIKVVRTIIRALQSQEPRHRYIVGAMGAVSIFLYSFLPSWLSDRMVRLPVPPAATVKNGRQGLLSWIA